MIEYSLNCLKKVKEEFSYLNIFDVLLSHGEKVAIEYKVDGEIKEIFFKELENPVKHVADKLIKCTELKKGGFIAIKLDNCPEWPVIFWGILMAGFKPFLVDFRHNEQLTKFFLKQVDATAIICAQEENVEGETKVITADELIVCDRKEIFRIAKRPLPKEGSYKERIRAYEWEDEIALCTSGTTSTAKVYTYNGEAMGNQIISAKDIIEENERLVSDREVKNLAFLPFHHIFGFLACYLWFSVFGKILVFPSGKAPSALLAACREHNVTHMLAVPLLINNIVAGINRKLSKESAMKRVGFKLMCSMSIFAQRISPIGGTNFAKKLFKKSVLESLVGTSLEVIISGGGHVLPDSLRTINAIGYFTVCGFGMTEVGVSSVDRASSIKRRLSGCVGVPVSSVEYRIVPLGDALKNTSSEIGELQMRGKSLHSAMMSDGKKLPPKVDEDGWFGTGDIGRMEKGALYIEGRLKEVIINESGENVYPDELEDYFTGIEGVSQYSVVGIVKNSASKYEDITLVMESSNELTDTYKKQILDEIMERNNKLPVFKRLSSVLLTNQALPLSNGIKVKRGEIKKQIEAGISGYVKIK